MQAARAPEVAVLIKLQTLNDRDCDRFRLQHLKLSLDLHGIDNGLSHERLLLHERHLLAVEEDFDLAGVDRGRRLQINASNGDRQNRGEYNDSVLTPDKSDDKFDDLP